MAKSQQEIGRQRKTLKANAEKALRLKRKGSAQTTARQHETASSGAIRGGEVGMTDTGVGREATWTSNLKRSHNARSGDS